MPNMHGRAWTWSLPKDIQKRCSSLPACKPGVPTCQQPGNICYEIPSKPTSNIKYHVVHNARAHGLTPWWYICKTQSQGQLIADSHCRVTFATYCGCDLPPALHQYFVFPPCFSMTEAILLGKLWYSLSMYFMGTALISAMTAA